MENKKEQQKQESKELYNNFDFKGFDSMGQTIEIAKEYVETARSGNRIVFGNKFPRYTKQLMGGWQPGKMYVYGGRPGCLSGDTMVWISRKSKSSGRYYRLEDIYQKFNGLATKNTWNLTKPTKAMSYDKTTKRLKLNLVEGVVESGFKDIFLLSTSNGKSIKATEEHKFLIDLDDNYKPLSDLNVGDVIYQQFTNKESNGKKKRPYRKEYISKMPYYYTAGNKVVKQKGKEYTYQRTLWQRIHYDAGVNCLNVEDFIKEVKTNPNHTLTLSDRKLEIHHIDGDVNNNAFGNLQLLTKEDHARLHSKKGHLHLKNGVIKPVYIVGINYLGKEMTYDIQMKSPMNSFVANSIVVHNSGKSQLTNQLLFDTLDIGNVKGHKLIVFYWSFEMPGYQQLIRIASGDLGVDVYDLIQESKDVRPQIKFEETINKFKEYPIYFMNIPKSLVFFQSKITQFCENNPEYTLINVIDHTRLFKGGNKEEMQRIADVTKTLMEVQSKYGCISVLLSQLNRNIESNDRANTQYQPMLSDLFGSDAVGQDAHVVTIINRPYDMYGIEENYCGESPRGLMALHIVKNREGQLGMVPLQTHYPSFKLTERLKQ